MTGISDADYLGCFPARLLDALPHLQDLSVQTMNATLRILDGHLDLRLVPHAFHQVQLDYALALLQRQYGRITDFTLETHACPTTITQLHRCLPWLTSVHLRLLGPMVPADVLDACTGIPVQHCLALTLVDPAAATPREHTHPGSLPTPNRWWLYRLSTQLPAVHLTLPWVGRTHVHALNHTVVWSNDRREVALRVLSVSEERQTLRLLLEDAHAPALEPDGLCPLHGTATRAATSAVGLAVLSGG